MENFICVQCGVQFSQTAEPPPRCPICKDERQFVRHDGQQWTTLQEVGLHHYNRFEEEALQLLGIGTEPEFAIGQRALLVQSPAGNLLWDCISLLDDETIAQVKAREGIRAIAISHPHFYSSMVEWAERFDAQIYLHTADRQWVMRESPRIHFWEGTTLPLWGGLKLINCGGHFEGGTVLHWPAGANGKGALLTSDILTVVQDRRYVSFMRSYPNLIPLGPAVIDRILKTLEPFSFDQIYGGWFKANVLADAKAGVARSAERYLRAINGSARGD
jgi:glyoxylase-like metal-dependent hydrolase (beta-lactamase superfamily II)